MEKKKKKNSYVLAFNGSSLTLWTLLGLGCDKFCTLSALDSLVDPLQKTINFKPKQDAVKQEVDRNEDMSRSALLEQLHH